MGKINKEDILCSWFCIIFTVGDFDKHAGGKSFKCYECIYLDKTWSWFLAPFHYFERASIMWGTHLVH